ncbi:MAG: exodeoxyribonuclease VII small subunit [Armatimonadota bacterium]
MAEKTEQENRTFEQALARLEEIASLLDRNEVALADALQLCAEAAALSRYCREQLAEAEGKLEQLVEAANGKMRIDPLEEA